MAKYQTEATERSKCLCWLTVWEGTQSPIERKSWLWMVTFCLQCENRDECWYHLSLLVSSVWGPHEMILATFRLSFALSIKSLWRHPHWHPHGCILQWFQSQASWQGGWILTETLGKLKHCYWSPTRQTETLLLNSYLTNWNIVAESLVLPPCVYSCLTLLPQIVTVSSALQAFVVCLLSSFFTSI